jgi:streptomycin 6-kinase
MAGPRWNTVGAAGVRAPLGDNRFHGCPGHADRAVIVHGDVHQWNALQAGDGFKMVDPDGVLAEPEYDLGVVMREDPVELLAGDPCERARWLARRCGLDATAIWEWGVVERVSTSLLCTRIGLQPVGREMLTAADHVAGM